MPERFRSRRRKEAETHGALLRPPPHIGGCVLAIAICGVLLASAQTRYSTEYEIKAAVLFNLGQFVEWPSSAFASAESPLIVGILGQNPFGQSLERAVEGEIIQKRRIVVKYGETLDALGTSHILFICRSEARKLPDILKSLKGKPTLTVSDMGQFAQNGGMVNLVTTADRVRMIVNAAKIEAAGLRASSKLLRIAELVKTE
ncbi:MAG TPA: YfiR family protein [Candidatus Binatia bacterium]|nr:YfiR family protein [Candidatus Binatia bacterium]